MSEQPSHNPRQEIRPMNSDMSSSRFTPEACVEAHELFWQQQLLAHQHSERKKKRRANTRRLLGIDWLHRRKHRKG